MLLYYYYILRSTIIFKYIIDYYYFIVLDYYTVIGYCTSGPAKHSTGSNSAEKHDNSLVSVIYFTF